MKSKYGLKNTPEYRKRKQQRVVKMIEMQKRRTINSGRDYLIMVNGISGKDRIDSRVRVISGRKKDSNVKE